MRSIESETRVTTITFFAVVAQRTLGISVKKMCHVANMKEVSA